MGRRYLVYLGVDRRIILKLILRRVMWGCGLDSVGSKWGPLAVFTERGNESSDSLKTRNFLAKWATINFWKKSLYRGVSYLSPNQKVSQRVRFNRNVSPNCAKELVNK